MRWLLGSVVAATGLQRSGARRKVISSWQRRAPVAGPAGRACAHAGGGLRSHRDARCAALRLGATALKLVALRGPFVMALICAVPLLLWVRSAPLGPRFSNSTLALTSTAVLFAFAGTAAFAINLMLGARIRFVEKLFGGLDRMYRVHRQNGQIAFALLAMHAFLIFAGRVTISVSSGFDLVTPRAGRVIFAGFVAITLMGIALVLTLFVRLGQEVFVYVQRTFG